tara:strand:- start:24 stop:3104 length:3081 start_codon:yes stop_codon:yes gene_type:complete
MKLYLNLFFTLLTSAIFAQNTSKNQPQTNPYVPGDVIIQVYNNVNIRDLVASAPQNFKLEIAQELSPTSHIWLLNFDPNSISHESMIDWLYGQHEIQLAQNNYYLKMRSTIPNDATFTSQWHHNNTGQTGGTADADIDSDLAWDITTGGTTASGHDIVVCLIESGNLDHQDLSPNRWINTNEIENNGVDDDGNGYVDDYNGWNPLQNNDNYGTGGHGTNCLGMIGAKGNNGLNVVGANWDVKLMVVGGYNINTDANAIQAYQYPYDMRVLWNNSGGAQGAFVVATSSSWGIDGENPNNHPVWCNFYTTMGEAGILNVGATTNSNLNVDTAGDMPTACDTPYMIGVGRTDHNDNTAGGYGATTIEFGAPGINVVTTSGTSGTTSTTGTSFSCPLTAGVIGLAYSIPCDDFMNTVIANPQMGADMVLQAMMDGTDPKSQLANKFVTGGRLNSRNTLDELMAVGCNGSICFGPSAVSVDDVTENDANILFTAQSEADITNLYWREVGNNNWIPELDISSPVTLNGLNSCSEYEFYLESSCGGDISNPTSIQTFATFGCGACIDNQYCTNAAYDEIDEWIESFTIDTYTNTSGNDGGYGDFTGNPIQLDVDNTYDIDIEVAWSGTIYDEQSRIWIDLDQDGEFGTDELVFDQGTADQTVNVIGQVTIPEGTPLGITRMRVQMAYVGNQTELPEVCGGFQWGEVEDYCVEILSGITCGFGVENTIVNPLCNGNDNGSISVDVGGGTGNYAYSWSSNLGSNSGISNVSAGNYSIVITDVEAGCDTTINFTLENEVNLSVAIEAMDISCNGLTDGSVQAIPSGSSDYSFQWTGGPNTNFWDGLASGTYEVTVTDGNGCIITSAANVQEPAADQASFTSNINFLNVQFNNTSSPGAYLWDFGDGNTSNSTSPQHSYALPGTYEVCLTVSTECADKTTCISITVDEDDSSLDENYANYVSVYPNPTNSIVNFYVTHPNVRSIVIMDIVGKEVLNSNIDSELTQINIREFSNGTYFYRLRGADGRTLMADKLFKVK